MAERRLDQVLDGEVDVGGRGDDEGVLAAGLGVQSHAGAPAEEEIGGGQAAREHDLVDTVMGHQVAAHLVVGRADQLDQVSGDSRLVQVVDQRSGDGACLGRGLEDDGRAGGDRVHEPAGGDGVGEVPRPGDEHERVRLPLQTLGQSLMRERQVCRIGREVDRLADLRIALAQRLARRARQGGEGVAAMGLHHLGDASEHLAPLLPAHGLPLLLRRASTRHGVIDSRRGRDELGLGVRGAREDVGRPGAVARCREVCVRDVAE